MPVFPPCGRPRRNRPLGCTPDNKSIDKNVSVGAQNTLAPFFEFISQIISCVVLDRMLSRHLKTQHAQMNHGLQSMRQFALTKCTLISTMTSIKTKLIVCGTKEQLRNCKIFEHRKLPYITCLREAHIQLQWENIFPLHLFLFFLLPLNFFPLRLRHQRFANKIRPDGAPSFTSNAVELV